MFLLSHTFAKASLKSQKSTWMLRYDFHILQINQPFAHSEYNERKNWRDLIFFSLNPLINTVMGIGLLYLFVFLLGEIQFVCEHPSLILLRIDFSRFFSIRIKKLFRERIKIILFSEEIFCNNVCGFLNWVYRFFVAFRKVLLEFIRHLNVFTSYKIHLGGSLLSV